VCHFYYLLCFLFNKIRERESGTGSARKQGGGGAVGISRMCTHVNKCKNDKIKERKKLDLLLICFIKWL
jgi:hypothetical protein